MPIRPEMKALYPAPREWKAIRERILVELLHKPTRDLPEGARIVDAQGVTVAQLVSVYLCSGPALAWLFERVKTSA